MRFRSLVASLAAAFVALLALSVLASASPAPDGLLTDEIPVGFDAVDKFFYEGEEISAKVVEAEELACVQTESGHYCFDDVASADRAFSDDYAKTNAQTGTNAPAALPPCAVGPLWEYKKPSYTGGAFSLIHIGAYINYAKINNNSTTSFQSGKAASIFALWRYGRSLKYSGPGTEYCGYRPTLRRPFIWNNRNWNNRFSSRARIAVSG